MKIHRIFENIIREEQVNSQTEKCVKMFGHELFSPQLGGNEPNTDYESKILQDIFNFTLINYGKTISPEFIKAAKNLHSCMSSYPEVLYPKGTVYRGTKMTLGKFININYKPKQWNKIEYVANTPIQSWTEDFEVAEDFAASQIDGYTYQIIDFAMKGNESDMKSLLEQQGDVFEKFKIGLVLRHAATPDQFLFKAKYFNLLSQAGENVGDVESEVLRIDNRPIIVDAMIPAEYEDKILKTIEKIKQIL